MKNTFLSVLIIVLATAISPIITSAQQTITIRKSGFTAEKQADGQTRWMTKYLGLNSTLAGTVYRINLKYLQKTDSLRMTTAETVNKNNLHRMIIQGRNVELQSVLSPEQYNKYMAIFTDAKKNVP